MRVIATALFFLLLCLVEGRTDPLRVLMLSGSNNHDWKATTPVLKKILEDSGKFTVDVELNVPSLRPEAFTSYDVVLSNFNTYGQNNPGEVWNGEVRKAFLSFIQSGHGLVIVHAGSAVFSDWTDFQNIAGATWGPHTEHGQIHTNQIHILPGSNPITSGMADFETTDEYWQNALVAPGAEPLAEVTPKPEFHGSGKAEPIAFVTHFGDGRGFTLLLGHDVHGMESAGFKDFLVRGTEWAATGKVGGN